MGWVHVLLFIAACDTLSAALMPRVKKPSVTIITSSLQNMSLVASQEVSLPMQTIEIQKRSRRSVGGDNVINVKVDITIDGEIEFDDETDDGSKRTKRAVGACKFKGKIYASGQPWEVTKDNKVYLCSCPDIGSISKKIKCARKAVEAPKPQTSFASSSTSATTSEFVTAEAIVCRAGEEELALGESVQTTHEGVPYTCECMINNGQPDIACTPQSEPGETETVYGDPGTVDFFCNIPDGRRIPAGETFIHTVGSVEYTCKCPANLGPEEQELGQIQIECEQRLDGCPLPDGGNVPEGEPFKYHFGERQFSCTCDEATVGEHPVGDQRSHCDLPDGRTMPVGQEFDFTHEGLALICTCDTDKSDSIQCRPKASSVACDLPDGRSFSVGEKFRYVHEGKRIFCTCEENGDSTMPACINYLQDDEFCFLDDLRDIPRGEHFEYTLIDGMSYNCQCPPAGSADTSISCTQQAFRCSMPDGSTANAGDEKVLEKDGVQYLCKCPLTSPPEGHSIQCSHLPD